MGRQEDKGDKETREIRRQRRTPDSQITNNKQQTTISLL